MPLPEIPSYRQQQTSGSTGAANDIGGTKVALRTEEEQQAAAREREERERARLEKEIQDRRDARRKSLANRRVSFAAEATLHTFHDIEEMQDSTTSTDSTRRQHQQQSSDSDPPSTPPDVAEEDANESPANQRRRRRSSAASSMYGSDDTVGSTVYDSDYEHADSVAEINAVEMENSSDEDGTIMTVEAEEMTSASTMSPRSAYEGDTSESLDENLRLAARRAITQSIGEDEEVIAGFAGWGKKNTSRENVGQNNNASENHTSANGAADTGSDAGMDMDLTKPVGGGVLYPELPSPDKEDEINEDLSMDVTTALGGILSKATAFLRRKSVNPNPQPDPGESGEQTMDLTTAVGGIRQSRVSEGSPDGADVNEDMSMEFTNAVGGLLSANSSKAATQSSRRQTIAAEDGDDDGAAMEITTNVGRILPAEAEEEEEEADQTMGMDMTTAVGGIIKSASTPESRSAARKVMEQEADEPHPSITRTAASPERFGAGDADGDANPESSPFRDQDLHSAPAREASPMAGSPQPSSSPMRLTPSPQKTAAQSRRSPTRTPPSAPGSKPSSPVRNLSSPIKTTPLPLARSLFRQDPSTGLSTPRVVLTPQGRRLSGVGADRPGLGSPRVAEIFDRRESLGEAAGSFVPTHPTSARRNVAFANPREMEAEIDRDAQDEDGREDNRGAGGSREDREGSANLLQMIQELSPKKNPVRGRKSLHVGSARGLLGKRPAELDETDEDDEERDGVKRLKGHQGSPVKNIRLQSPPSKAETTTGRKTRPSIRPTENPETDNATPTRSMSPQRPTTPTTTDQGRFQVATDDQPTTTFNFNEPTMTTDLAELRRDDDGERIHLRDFLNMTSIRFMELTTTKRRHTVVPSASRESTAAGGKDDLSLERCVVAGACTVPMLEMYQHVRRRNRLVVLENVIYS